MNEYGSIAGSVVKASLVVAAVSVVSFARRRGTLP